MGTKQILETVFNDVRLVTFVYDNREVWFASQIAEVLGYSRPKQLSTQIRRGEWQSQFIEGVDFYVMRNDEVISVLKDFAGAFKAPAKVRHSLVLTEKGVNNVLILSRKCTGVRLRRHLSDVVLPQFRRGMIEERPIEELEAAYRQEVDQLKTKLIERDEEVIQLHREKSDLQHEHIQLLREKAEMLGAKPYV